jgi:hypothetical protein
MIIAGAIIAAFHQFKQDTGGAGGMDEDVTMSAGTYLNLLVDKPGTTCLEALDGLAEIGHVKCKVV